MKEGPRYYGNYKRKSIVCKSNIIAVCKQCHKKSIMM